MKLKKPKTGEIQTIKKFLFFPIEINDEIRWLCQATIKRQKKPYFDAPYIRYWDNLEFLD